MCVDLICLLLQNNIFSIETIQNIFILEFPVACHRDDIFLAFGCGRKADNTTRIALCLADTLSYSISREVS